ncbi:hypothetical protein ABHN84_20845 [Shewanella vesiculosa]|uniref:Sulfatase-modifying factor enzyme domain-containing protein n=1 Tax=Shewanella vesiculosa TaxID=518738 RepID=A0ABV0FXH7_9GAMM
MAELTICPHFLTDYNLTTPAEVEKVIIMPLIKCLKKAKEDNIQIVLSKEILIKHRNNYPWSLSVDPLWSKHLSLWDAYITSYIGKARIIDVPHSVPKTNKNCNTIQASTSLMFARFLEVFGKGLMHGGIHEEAIYISEDCKYPQQLNRYLLVNTPHDFNKIIFPWLRFYKKKLPYEGEFPFVPPTDWRKHPNPNKASYHPYGFLDVVGNVWQWDHFHGEQWDVQHSEGYGNYSNVNCEGKVLSRK